LASPSITEAPPTKERLPKTERRRGKGRIPSHCAKKGKKKKKEKRPIKPVRRKNVSDFSGEGKKNDFRLRLGKERRKQTFNGKNWLNL